MRSVCQQKAQVAQQRWQESVSTSTDAARRFATAAEPWFDAALAQERLGNGELAQVAYEQALARDAGHLGSLLNLAGMLQTTAPARARELLQHALKTGGSALSASERDRIEKFLAAQ